MSVNFFFLFMLHYERLVNKCYITFMLLIYLDHFFAIRRILDPEMNPFSMELLLLLQRSITNKNIFILALLFRFEWETVSFKKIFIIRPLLFSQIRSFSTGCYSTG